MSTLLDEIIAARKRKAVKYEEYLQRIAALAAQVQTGKASGTPKELDTPGKRALFNNLDAKSDASLALALNIDEIIKQIRPDGWRGNGPKEQIIKNAMYGILQDVDEVERLFPIIKQQREY